MADEFQPETNGQARIIVFGVGGGGGNAVEHMVRQNVKGITFVCANTDLQALNKLSAPNKIQIGAEATRGLGAGANPEVGRNAAESNEDEIRAMLEGYDMAFITAGMGGGTGTGAAPVVARIAKEMGILTVAVVTTPFTFEGKRRTAAAQSGIEALTQHVDSIITIPNDKLTQAFRNLTMVDAFKKADDVLLYAVNGLTETIVNPGVINIDFMDVRTAMTAKGHAMMGIGRASGNERAAEAMEKAIRSPLLDDLNLRNAQGLIINIIGSGVGMDEVMTIVAKGQELMADDANVFYGLVEDDNMGDEIHVTVVATGLTVNTRPAAAQPAVQAQQAQQLASHTSAIAQQAQPVAEARPGAPKPISVGSYLQQQQQQKNS
ncbi:cell division protein FtsZ [Moraxella pluranimalium]|uniref:Cell division protein FtsZ n=1 Tax=Moraxella pluranimalium TaxID=470453 RepID=A0A1T0CK08_9GAMM|nr:cell division protein FtsZ [Moraxella pluranimalium]OOS22654.1 cell division protein FtsZ [Moraxella pluranimalium]